MSHFGRYQIYGHDDDLFVQEPKQLRPVKSQYWPVSVLEPIFPRKELGKTTSVHSNVFDEASNFGFFSEPESTHVHPRSPEYPEKDASKSEDRLKCPNSAQCEVADPFEHLKLQSHEVPTSLRSQSAIASPANGTANIIAIAIAPNSRFMVFPPHVDSPSSEDLARAPHKVNPMLSAAAFSGKCCRGGGGAF